MFQGIVLGKKAGNLLKAEAVAVMAGYHAILLHRNDVADAHRRVVVICRVVKIELLIQAFQCSPGIFACGKFPGVNQIIVGPLHRQPMGLQPVHIHKTHIVRVSSVHLIDGKAVTLMGQERCFPFLLMVVALHDLLMELRACLPFRAGEGKNRCRGLYLKILPVKEHFRAAAVHNGVDGQILVKQLHGLFPGKGQHIAVHVAAGFQIGNAQGFIRHGVFVQRLLRGIGQHGCGRHSFSGWRIRLYRRFRRLLLHLLIGRFLQGFHQVQRGQLDGFRSHIVHPADFQGSGGERKLRAV